MTQELAVIGVPSWLGKATFSGGSWDADYPVTQLGKLPLGKPAVTADGTTDSTKFIVTLSEFLPVQYLCWVGHTGGQYDLFTMRFFSDVARSNLVLTLSDQEFWLPCFPKGSVDYGDPHWWTEKYTAEEIAAFVAPPRPIWLDAPIGVRAIEVDVDVTPSGADSFACGYFDLGQGTQVAANYDYGAQLGFEARVITTISPGGTAHHTDDPEPRTWRGTFGHVEHTTAMGRFFELMRRPRRAPFLWLPTPSDPTRWLQEAWLAELAELSPIERAYADVDAIPLTLREVF
ncbi:MAG: hypothetical protein RIB84_00620 [Sneathiellaceae bacterium]